MAHVAPRSGRPFAFCRCRTVPAPGAPHTGHGCDTWRVQRVNRRPIAVATAGVLTALALATAPVSASAAQPAARVYVSLPREGKGAASAALIATGLRTALADNGGRAGGQRIRIVWMNDAKGERWDRARVVANARRAAADPRAIAYVGEGNSEATAVSMPIVNRAGLAHLSPVSTATTLTDATTAARYQPTGTQTFFRPMPGDDRQASALLSAVRRAGARHRVVVVDDGGLYGRGLTLGVRAGADAARVGVVGRYVASPDGRGLSALARRVAAKRPTAIVYGGSPSSNAAVVLRRLHRAAPRAVLVSGDALAHDGFVRQLGRSAQAKVRFTTPAAHVDPRRKAGRALGTRPDPFAVFAYNGMQALLGAVDRAAERGPVTRASVRAAVFDGAIQPGLSGAWKITARGDSVYGVYDIVHAAAGRISTPAQRLTDELVRRELARDRASAKRRAGSRAAASGAAHAGSTSPSLPALTIGATDLESAMLAVQQQRTQQLDEQLRKQIEEVQNRNAQIAKLNDVLGGLNTVLARVPGASALDRLGDAGPVEQYAADVAALRSAIAAAGVTLGLGPDAGGWTRGELEVAITSVKGAIDSAANSQQMEMLRLQGLSNKRNEAFEVMAAFIKKLQANGVGIPRSAG